MVAQAIKAAELVKVKLLNVVALLPKPNVKLPEALAILVEPKVGSPTNLLY